jgi:3,4-dihydroxy-9,10-secoandrosta-1,3,5(10)-triene-9,17-dione 4,5-dioxygenase
MGVKALGYVVIETTKPDMWDEFLTQLAGVMRAPDADDGAALYRIDDRVFRFRIERSDRDWFKAAGYEVGSAAMNLTPLPTVFGHLAARSSRWRTLKLPPAVL